MNITNTEENNENVLIGAFKTALSKFQTNLQICLPCVVTSVDRQKNKVSVKPIIKILTTDNNTLERPQIFNIPIANFSAGGFIINLPVKVGDLGFIKTCDRDITLFKQSFKEAKPNTKRKNNFADGVFYPDTINNNNWNIANEDLNNLVIQTYDNSTKISLGSNKITLQADTIEYKANNYNFIGGNIKQDGVSIGKDHIHAQGSDGNGDAEQDTTTPIN